MSDSIKNKLIWRLTNGRALSDGEIRELDNLQAALDLDENDPYWGQVAWIWATTPRKTDFEAKTQAITHAIEDKFRVILEQLDLFRTFQGDKDEMREIKISLDNLIQRPIPDAYVSAPVKIDQAALSESVAAAIQVKGGAHAQIDFVKQFKDAVREGVSWVWVSMAGVGFALALVLGYVGGETVQVHADGAQIQALQGQVSTLTAVVAGKASRGK